MDRRWEEQHAPFVIIIKALLCDSIERFYIPSVKVIIMLLMSSVRISHREGWGAFSFQSFLGMDLIVYFNTDTHCSIFKLL